MPCNWALTIPLLPKWEAGGNDLIWFTQKGLLCPRYFSWVPWGKNTRTLKAELINHFTRNSPNSKTPINYHKTIPCKTTLLYLTYTENSHPGISCIFPFSVVYIVWDLHSFFSPCKTRDIPGICVCIAMVTQFICSRLVHDLTLQLQEHIPPLSTASQPLRLRLFFWKISMQATVGYPTQTLPKSSVHIFTIQCL